VISVSETNWSAPAIDDAHYFKPDRFGIAPDKLRNLFSSGEVCARAQITVSAKPRLERE
jgi:hypothetical protein